MCFHELAVYKGPPRMLVFSRSDMGKRCDCPFFLHPLFVIVNPNPASQASVVQYRLIHRKNHSTVTSYSLIAILHHLFFSQAQRLFSHSIIYSYPLTCSGATDLPVVFYFGIYNCFSL